MNTDGRATRVISVERRPARRDPAQILAELVLTWAMARYILSTVDFPVDTSGPSGRRA